eukprot:jgi/Chrzof1/4848/Cz15g01140.t1
MDVPNTAHLDQILQGPTNIKHLGLCHCQDDHYEIVLTLPCDLETMLPRLQPLELEECAAAIADSPVA